MKWKSTTHFPMSLRWSSYVAPNPPRGSKTQNGRFPSKIALRLKKVCYKVSFFLKNDSGTVVRQSCYPCKMIIGATWNFGKAAIALSNRTGSTATISSSAHPYHPNLRIHTGVQLHLAGPISICNRTIWLGTQQASSLSSPAVILPCQLALLLDTALSDLSEKSSRKRNEASWNRAATSCLHYNADGPRANRMGANFSSQQ